MKPKLFETKKQALDYIQSSGMEDCSAVVYFEGRGIKAIPIGWGIWMQNPKRWFTINDLMVTDK